MNIFTSSSTLFLPVILEGRIYSDVLKEFNAEEDWLKQHWPNRESPIPIMFL